MKLIIILLLITINYTFGDKTIKLSVEYPRKNHYCHNERDTILQINYLSEHFRKENYYYNNHELIAITNTVKIVPTKYNTKSNKSVVYYNYIIFTIDVIFSDNVNTTIQEIKMSDECKNYFSKQDDKNNRCDIYCLMKIIFYAIIFYNGIKFFNI
jgi:hypothetical protein